MQMHMEKHSNDAQRSLAVLGGCLRIRHDLERIGDQELNVSLGILTSEIENAAQQVDAATIDAAESSNCGRSRFTLLRPHASGGLGEVWIAKDNELNREVAVKRLLAREDQSPQSKARFLLEAEITGGLEHPGIVPVYSLRTYGNGSPYYAMRFIRGDTLKEVIDHFHTDQVLAKNSSKRLIELRKLLHRFNDVCNAVEYAHSRGVLHRDIKPGNVIIGKHGETLVVDWGVAKPLGRVESGLQGGEQMLVPSATRVSPETLPGAALGTPAYMSPEQAQGDLATLGPRSDVYSLGATLYCLLTGKPPVEGVDVGAVDALCRTVNFYGLGS